MGSEVEMIFSSSGANCSILVVMAAPPAHGIHGTLCRVAVSVHRLLPTLSTGAYSPINYGGRGQRRRASAQTAGPRARGQSAPTRQPQHREVLHRLDSPLHSFSRQAPS